MMSTSGSSARTLLDTLLDEQGQLTAVDAFVRAHAQRSAVPSDERHYRALLPLAKPGPGEQYAFSVDLDRCTGCKACVSACHSLNGLDDHEAWRTTGLLHGGSTDAPYQQVITSACHHCVEPACLSGCPVLAYEKDPATGIVRHLDDQCIGCQYCILKCPYDVPQYSSRRGIVRKCDMCHSRIGEGEAPACAQACPSSAIQIQVVSVPTVQQQGRDSTARLLPGVAPSNYTLPTSAYTSLKDIPSNATPADAQRLRPEPAHWPLIWMLLLTQLAAGLSLWRTAVQWILPQATLETSLSLGSCGSLFLGLAISVLHLGRPRGAWRAFLGWRRSWMSREIIAFGGFAMFNALATLGQWSGWPMALNRILNFSATVAGLLSVFCSAMVYIDTRRSFWQWANLRFFGTTLLFGSSGAAAVSTWLQNDSPAGVGTIPLTAGLVAIAVCIAFLISEALAFRSALKRNRHPNHGSARLMAKQFPHLLWLRGFLIALSMFCEAFALGATGGASSMLAAVAFGMIFASQLVERYLFFVAVVAPRMPGGVAG